MEIIVLEDNSGTGKTETIDLIYDLVIKAGGKSTAKKPLGGDPRDFEDIVINYKSKTIAFFSMGDYSNALADGVRRFAAANCHLMVCALSLNGSKVNANNAINLHGKPSRRIRKTIESNKGLQSATNLIDAQKIFAMI